LRSWHAQIADLRRGQGLRAQLVRGVLGVGGIKLLSLPLTFGASILLARGLGPLGYGQYVFVLTLLTTLALPVGPGLGQLVTREVAKYKHGAEWSMFRGLLNRANCWVLSGSLVYIVVIITLAGSYAHWETHDRWSLLALAAFLVPFLGFNSIRGNTLRGLKHVILAQLPDLVLKPAVHLIIASILLLAGMLNPLTVMGGQLAATGAAFLVGSVLLARRIPKQVKTTAPEYQDSLWLRAILPFTLLAAVGSLNSQIGILLLGWLGSPEEVAVMQICMSSSSLVVFCLALINMVISPHIISSYKDGNKERLRKISRYSSRIALMAALPLGIPLILFGAPIIKFVYGNEYADSAALPLAILTAGQVFNVACGSVGQFLTMSGFEKDTLFAQISALLANVIMAIVLIPKYGSLGAASAVAAGLVIWNILLVVLFKKRLGFMPTVLG